MEVGLTYGGRRLSVSLPDKVVLKEFGTVGTLSSLTFDSFARVFGVEVGPRLASADKILIVVNDGYRRTPTAQMLTWLDTIDSSLLGKAEFLVATGAHAPPTLEHLQSIFGPHLERVKEQVGWHDATDSASMTRLGVDRFGQEVLINSKVVRSSTLFVIGSVEPHYFAGYTGGRKSFFPGLCDLATIERNHNLANSLKAAPLALTGNPVAEHLDSLMCLLNIDRILTAQIVMDSQGRIADTFCGRIDRAFLKATERAAELYAARVRKPFDAVIAEVAPPLDRNLYQAQKALENTQAAVVDGGAVVIVSACAEGIGSKYFFDQATGWDRQRNEPVDGVFRFGSHKLSRVNAIGRRIDVLLKSELPDESVRHVFYEPVHDLIMYFDNEIARRPGRPFRLAVVHDAGHTVLRSSDSC